MENTKKYDLEDRLILFSVMVLKLADQLPNTYAGRHLSGQITRSATSPALNYGEAQAAESRADFTHKLKICHKELRETQICLKIIIQSNLIKPDLGAPVLKECGELVAIFTATIDKIKKQNELKK
jgi:four helix bundle protein